MVDSETTSLYMFYGMLNLNKLTDVLPFPPELETKEARYADLKSKAVALTCNGYSRVFGQHHASIQADPLGQIKTFSVLLTPEQSAFTDQFEGLGYYYDSIEVDVILHRQGRPDESARAKVYTMTENTVR